MNRIETKWGLTQNEQGETVPSITLHIFASESMNSPLLFGIVLERLTNERNSLVVIKQKEIRTNSLILNRSDIIVENGEINRESRFILQLTGELIACVVRDLINFRNLSSNTPSHNRLTSSEDMGLRLIESFDKPELISSEFVFPMVCRDKKSIEDRVLEELSVSSNTYKYMRDIVQSCLVTDCVVSLEGNCFVDSINIFYKTIVHIDPVRSKAILLHRNPHTVDTSSRYKFALERFRVLKELAAARY